MKEKHHGYKKEGEVIELIESNVLFEMAEIESEKSYWKEEDEPIRDRVIGTLRKKRGFVPISDIKLIALLRKMSIFGYSGATNYLITEDQGKVLLKMFDSSKVLVNA